MAEIRISGRDLANLDRFQRELAGLTRSIDARAVEGMAADVADKINGGIGKILENFDGLAARAGITDPGTAKNVRSAFEAAEGATFAAKEVAPFLPLVAASPHVRLALLGGAAALGGLEGLGREEARKLSAQARQIEADLAYLRQREIEAFDLELKRREAARKAAARLR